MDNTILKKLQVCVIVDLNVVQCKKPVQLKKHDWMILKEKSIHCDNPVTLNGTEIM